MQILLDTSADVTSCTPRKRQDADGALMLTADVKLTALMTPAEAAFIFAVPVNEDAESQPDMIGERYRPVNDLFPGLWTGNGSPVNSHVKVDNKGYEIEECSVRVIESMTGKKSRKAADVVGTFHGCKLSAFTVTPEHGTECEVTFKIYIPDVPGESVGSIAEKIKGILWFEVQVEDLFDKIQRREDEDE